MRTSLNRLSETIKGFLYYADRALSPVEMQKIIFYSDTYSTEKLNGRLTKARFKPMMYGAYSYDIKDKINDIKNDSEAALIKKSVLRSGKTDPAYIYLEPPSIGSSDRRQLIEDMIGETEDLDLDHLTTLSKENWLYRNTDDDAYMDFSDYRDALPDEADPIIGVYDQDATRPDWLHHVSAGAGH